MSNQYLLPCECGRTLPIEVHQAGQSLTCSCGKQLTVPSLRAIRQLPAATAEAGPASAKSADAGKKWGPLQGTVFFLGAILFIAGIAISAHSYYIYSLASQVKPDQTQYDKSLEEIDKMSAAEVFEFWHIVSEMGMEAPESSIFAHAGNIAATKLRLTYAGAIATVVGLVTAIVSTFLGSTASNPTASRKPAAQRRQSS